jgi:hypothetical protein
VLQITAMPLCNGTSGTTKTPAETRRLATARLRLFALFCICALLSGCSDGHRLISEPYTLERDDNDVYNLRSKVRGLVAEAVEKIGWSGTTILVFRSGDLNGWMVVDTKTNKIEGPIPDSERQARFPNIVCYPVEDAWNKL